MRLGLVIYGSLDTLSGGYLYDRVLVRHLRAQGDEVEIISLPWQGYGQRLLHNLQPQVRRQLKHGRWDLLLQDELNHPSLFWLNRSVRGGAPLVSIVHHLRVSEARPAWQNVLYRAVERAYLRSVDAFVFNSRTTQRTVQALAGARPGVVAWPGGDRFGPPLTPDEVRARARQPGPLRLLFLGNLIPRKGLHSLLRALNLLPQGWSLRVAGSPDVDPAYVRQLRPMLGSGVSLLGALSDVDLRQELCAAQVLVVPSTYEGFGIVYLEGMGFGLPAVGTTLGAAGEIITPGENGLLVPPEDPAALAHALHGLLNDRARLERLSLGALERFRAHPTWEQSAKRIRDFLLAQAHEMER